MPRRWPEPSALLSWTTLVGVAMAAAGLGWDAVIHARDPLLAQHEGVFTTSNPAHVLLGAGLFLAFAAQLAFVSLRISGMIRRLLAAGLAVLGVGVIAAVGWSQQVNAADAAAAQRLVDSTRAGTLKYRNLATAVRDGYEPVTPLNWPMVEWVNPRFTRSGRVIDTQHPERLMYITGAGGPVLAGAMYVMPSGSRAVPPVAAGFAHWHQHLDLCYLPNGTIAGTDGYGQPCPGGSTPHPTPAMLHVWIVANPLGPFAEDMTPAAIAEVIAHE